MQEHRLSDDGYRAIRTRYAARMARYAGLLTLIPGLVALGLIFLSKDLRLVWAGTALLAGLDLFLYVQHRGRPGASVRQARSLLLACLIAVLAGAGLAMALGAFP